MKPCEINDNGLLVSDDKSRLDLALIFDFLRRHSYWAQEITTEILERAIENSLCFGVYLDGRQIGFARVVTDFATFAWLADVFIIADQRAKGFGKRLVAAVLAHPRLQGLRRFQLGTRDAHGLYAPFGFQPLAFPERFMEIRAETGYKCGR
jgi:GNAT superfamily N-acetyltransferase